MDEANPKYYAKDGVLFVKNYGKYEYPQGEELLHYPPEKRDAFYQVPEGLMGISYSAFEGHKYLTEVEIPDMMVIYDGAFRGCKKLKRAVISAESVCAYAF